MAQAQELDGKTILSLLDKHLFKPLAEPGANAEPWVMVKIWCGVLVNVVR
jgi:hypothetical protein